jgi:hypothetical protein
VVTLNRGFTVIVAVLAPTTSAPVTSAPTAPSQWGRKLLLSLLLLVGVGALAIWLGLDPWLRRTLEKQVAKQSHDQYALTIGALETKLLARTLHLRSVELRPTTPTLADTLPRVHLRLARLDISGVGLLAALRGQTIPVDSLTLDSVRLDVAALARQPSPRPTPPLCQQRPVRLGYLALRHVSGSFGPASAPMGSVSRADLLARDILFTTAGATDSQRLGFATAWQAELRRPQGRIGGHLLTLGHLVFSTTNRTLAADSVRIAPPAPGQSKPGAVRVTMAVAAMRLRGLQAAKWQHQHRFQADSLVAQQAHLSFKPPAKAPPPVWQLIKPLASRADLNHFIINEGFMAVTGLQHKPIARHIFVLGQSLRVDSLGGQRGQGRVLYARAWQAHSGRITAVFEAPAYPASIERVALNTKARTLRMTGLALRPVFTPAQLNRRSGYQVTQLRVHMPELWANDVDFGLLSDRSQVRVGRITAESPWVGLNSDGRGPVSHKASYITPEAMRKLHLPLEIGRLDLRNGTIATRYRGIETPMIGTLTISKLNGTLRNISNNPRRQSMAHPLTGTATGYVQGRSLLRVQLTAPLLDPQGRHHLWGSFGPAPISILNPMIVPTKSLGFNSGQVQSITFDLHADTRQITGNMRATYKDLKVEFYKYKQGELKKPLWAHVKTGLVNGIVIRDNNPRPGGRFVTGDMASQRERHFSVFSAWRQGLVTGVLNSVGVPHKLAQKLTQSQKTVPLP